MKIAIFASVWCQNVWDELIIKNEVKLLEQEFGVSTEFTVFTYDISQPFFEKENVSYKEYFPIDSKNPKNLIRNLKNFFSTLCTIACSNVIVIGGGGILYDTEYQSTSSPLDAWAFRVKLARILRKKIYFYAVGIDIKQQENEAKLKKMFSRVYKVTVRDTQSYMLLKSLGIHSEMVDDPVFSDTNYEHNEDIQQGRYDSRHLQLEDLENHDFENKTIWIALRKWYLWKSKNEQVEKLILWEVLNHIEKRGGKVMFLPHSFHKIDVKANDYEFLKEFLTPKRSIAQSMDEVYSCYTERKVDMILAMRLHSIILAHIYKIPYIALSYSKKTDEAIKKLSQ